MEKNFDHKKLQSKVIEILLKDWDPIGVRDLDEAKLEYDSYALTITGKLLNGTTDSELTDFLNKVIVQDFELPLNTTNSPLVSKKLISLVS